MAHCNNVLNCSSNGDCVDVDVCKCHIGYTGSACSETSCESLGYCSGTLQIFALKLQLNEFKIANPFMTATTTLFITVIDKIMINLTRNVNNRASP